MVAKVNDEKFDIVYFIKDSPKNEELKYSLRSVEENWEYRDVWFYGGCPDDLCPDRRITIKQKGLNKWEKVRNMLREAFQNEELSENIWLFNDDFFILNRGAIDLLPTYDDTLVTYIESIMKKNNNSNSEYTMRLRLTIQALKGFTILNYEVHKPMLINRRKALEVLDNFPNIGGFRSLYGNYWQIGGENRHDMKIKDLGTYDWEDWEFLSTSDESFKEGEVGRFIRERFNKKSRFEKEANETQK